MSRERERRTEAKCLKISSGISCRLVVCMLPSAGPFNISRKRWVPWTLVKEMVMSRYLLIFLTSFSQFVLCSARPPARPPARLPACRLLGPTPLFDSLVSTDEKSANGILITRMPWSITILSRDYINRFRLGKNWYLVYAPTCVLIFSIKVPLKQFLQISKLISHQMILRT